MPSGYWQKHGNFRLFPVNCSIFVYIYKKSKKLWKSFKMLSGSSSIFALSNNITCSQTHIGATVPLTENLQATALTGERVLYINTLLNQAGKFRPEPFSWHLAVGQQSGAKLIGPKRSSSRLQLN